jgi:hypothetical protein
VKTKRGTFCITCSKTLNTTCKYRLGNKTYKSLSELVKHKSTLSYEVVEKRIKSGMPWQTAIFLPEHMSNLYDVLTIQFLYLTGLYTKTEIVELTGIKSARKTISLLNK